MVYCTNCGEKNPEGAEYCSKCGSALYSTRVRRPAQYYEKSPWLPMVFRNWWIFIGLIIVLWGLTELLGSLIEINISFGAIVAIIFGVLIIMGALRRR